MAYAAVASLSQTIDLILNHHQNSISSKLKNQMISLRKHTIFLESFLEDSPQRVNFWEEEIIREGLEMAENIIELLLSDSLLKSKSKSKSKSTVGSSRSKSVKGGNQLPYGFRELKRVRKQIDSIVNRLKGIHTESMDHGPGYELMKIISLLRGGSSELETIGIYGGAGTGKTTLGRNVYNNPLIEEHFEIRAWSTACRFFAKKRIVLELLRCISNSKGESITDSMDDLVKSLFEKLDGRRYLIVVDDVRSLEVWNWLMSALPYNRNGSRIILITAVFFFCKCVYHFHIMDLLDDDGAWKELRNTIFNGDPCPPQLDAIGKMIVRRCRGNYGAFNVVSEILAAAEQTEAAWKDISDNMDFAYEDDSSTALEKVHFFSYIYLPHHLRPCLLYLASFPEDHDILVSKLIKLWVAEGFVCESECKSFEETGEEHMEDLVRRGLILIRRRKSNGKIKSIQIEDPMREFCLRQARIDNFFLHVSRSDSFDLQSVAMELQSCHRVSTCTYDDNFLKGVYCSNIRTVMLHLYDSRPGVNFSIGNVRLLRILDLSNAYNYDLPEAVFDLFHLRYLAFYCEFSISEAISNLQNLQTLIIFPRENDGRMFSKLSEGIWRMPQLRHLIVFPFMLPSPNRATPTLEDLQTLSRVVDFVCSLENLKMFPNLKKLALFYTDSRDVVEDYEPHNLIYLQNLEILKIEMNWSFKKEMSYAFPPTLKKLNLCNVQLAWEDIKIVASLPNLQVFKLRKNACIGETWETSEGGFSQLTFLLIEESKLKNWITKSSHFPKLKCLVLRCCLHLLEFPDDMVEIPTLECMELDGQNPRFPSAEHIEQQRRSLGYDQLYFQAEIFRTRTFGALSLEYFVRGSNWYWKYIDN